MHFSSRYRPILKLTSVVLLALICGACEKRPTVVTLANGSNPPTFKLSGNGYVWTVRVTAFPTLNELQDQTGKYVAIWEVNSNTKESMHTPAEKLAPITYGVVPAEFKQLSPKGPVQPLQEGTFYEFSVHTTQNESDRRGGFKFYSSNYCFTIVKSQVEAVACK